MINVGILTNSMEQSHREANSYAAGRGIPRILLDLKLITVLTASHDWTPSEATGIQSTHSYTVS
jgi:hypothetical protein